MKTLVLSNQKGGVGKTATVVHLAYDFAERGLNVAVVDLDPQGNASFTLKDYQSGVVSSDMFDPNSHKIKSYVADLSAEPGLVLFESGNKLADLEKRNMAEASQSFNKQMSMLVEAFDVVIVDTAPSLGVGMVSALLVADYVLSPIELEAYSMQGIKKMVAAISNIRKANTKLQFLGMMPSKVDRRNPRHIRHLDELAKAYPQFLIPTPIGLRSSIADALASRRPVWKIKKTAARKATQEVRELAAYVLKRMEIAK